MAKYADLFKNGKESPAAHSDGNGIESPEIKEEDFTILFVDDEEGILKALRRVFLVENYTILTAKDADDAIKIMEKEKINLVVSDHRMSGMTGAELLKLIKERWPGTIRIMLTGHADVEAIMGAVKEGAVFKFITKPWNDEDLRLTVSLALQQYQLMQENKDLKKITKRQEVRINNYATAMSAEHHTALGSILVKSGVIKQEDLDRALKEQGKEELLGETLVRIGAATDSKIMKALQGHLNIESIDLDEIDINPGIIKYLPRDYCERSRIVTIEFDNNQIKLAMADPSDVFLCDNIAFMTGLKIVRVLAKGASILDKLKNAYEGKETDISDDFDDISEIDPLDEIDIVISEDEPEINVAELIGTSKVPPIIRIVNAIIAEAIRYKASDIHIEPKSKYTVARYRIDGMLHTKIKIPSDHHLATISRIKIIAKMDIAERRNPQDGRITVKSGTRLVDIRVSTMPTINGEKIVMRMLDKSAAIKKMEDLGVSKNNLPKVNILLKKPQGIIVATGPTGSGKTTLLYAMLGTMLTSTKNYETIEDPVEYFLEGASQVYVREKVGMSFASILRSTLRQDPDVILVGEIRDYETADVAFKAALTGHLVLTTLHTNNSIASITRLIDIGIKPYLIASAIEGIMAQRLVRTVCKYCKVEDIPDKEFMQLLNIPKNILGETIYKGKGCEKCNDTGYLGRTGIFETFTMNDEFRHFISGNYKEAELMNMAQKSGMQTLLEGGIEKVTNGEVSLEELLRVLGPSTKYERKCEGCKRMIDAMFVYCPYCGDSKQDFCKACMTSLEKEWSICPHCGKSRYSDKAELSGA